MGYGRGLVPKGWGLYSSIDSAESIRGCGEVR